MGTRLLVIEARLELSEADHARCQAARLRGERSPVHRYGLDSGIEVGRPALPAAAVPEEGRDAVRRVS